MTSRCADALIENLTVFEMLLYTAEMKVDMRVPFREKCRKVQAVVDQLALNTCRDTRIGSQVARGISGARAPGWRALRVQVGLRQRVGASAQDTLHARRRLACMPQA